MEKNTTTITLDILLKSLENDFDEIERERIFNLLRIVNPSDMALQAAKELLEQNNWDHNVLKIAFLNAESRIDSLLELKSKRKQKNSFIKYAAILVVSLTITSYFLIQNNNSIDKFYLKEQGLPNLMSSENSNQWTELMILYKSNQLNKALELSNKIIVQKTENDTANYFHAVIAYDLNQYTIAKDYFVKTTKNKKSVFYDDSSFRLGFALYKLNESKEAKQQFEKVKNSNNPYKKEVEIILDKVFK